jgi:ribose transport system permease protein
MNSTRTRPWLLALNNAPVGLFGLVLAVFGALSPKFIAPANLLNIVIQASPTAIVASGMTFVLLTAGVDLSVGAIMFVAAAVGGKLVLAGTPLGWVLAAMLGVGLACGALNVLLITRLGIIAFIATLGTQYVERGFALWLTETRAMNLPDPYTRLATASWAGVPVPIVVLGIVLGLAHLTLTRTPFGRQVYAVGQDLNAARKAGVNTQRVIMMVYAIAGVCAAAGAILSLAQLGAVAPTFGLNKEFAAIAAAVLGGTSLFGGRGNVFPGTVLGALLIQSVENGLVILNADPYLYPLVTSAIIFAAVLIDGQRRQVLARLGQRKIRPEEAG